MIKLQQMILTTEDAGEKTATVVSESNLKAKLGFQPENQTSSTENAGKGTKPAFDTPEKQRVAQIAYEVIKRLEANQQRRTAPKESRRLARAIQCHRIA